MRYFSFDVKIDVRLKTKTPTFKILKKLICFYDIFILQVGKETITDPDKPFKLFDLKFDFLLLFLLWSMLKQYLQRGISTLFTKVLNRLFLFSLVNIEIEY